MAESPSVGAAPTLPPGTSYARASSPRTPVHPSRGYAVMEDDLPPGASAAAAGVSAGRLDYGCADEVRPGPDMGSPTEDDAHLVSSSVVNNALSSTLPTFDDVDETDAVAVSQEDDLDFVDPLSHEDVSGASVNNGGARSKSKREESRAARRRSLRLQARALDDGSCEPSSSSDELAAIEMMDEDDTAASKPSSRRRSLCILARTLSDQSDDTSAVEEAGKRKPKRRQSSLRGKEKAADHALSKRRSVGDGKTPAASGPAEMLEHATLPSSEKEDEPIAAAVSFESYEIGITENGHTSLVNALEKIAFDIVVGPSHFNNVSKRKGSGRSKKRGRRSNTSVLAMLDADASTGSAVGLDKENGPNSSGRKSRPRNRRDTFDLSRKRRGLTSAAKRMDDLNVFIDDTVPGEDEDVDYHTPKNGTEVNVDAIVNEISRSLDDEPSDGSKPSKEDEVLDSAELSLVKNNLQHLTSIGIEERMRQLFPEKMGQLYNYPCVSARLFAALNIIYEDQANFTPLLPFLHSLIDAEIVSLKSKEGNEVRFLSKKVHFSGFDYSSTTTVVGAVVGQGGGDLSPSIEALESILQHALKLPRPMHYFTVAIQCLECMASCRDASEACAKTMLGYYPSARFERAVKHYIDELKDIKRYVTATSTIQVGDDHLGIRYRLNDFIGRSVRFHLRELLNSIPEDVVDLDTRFCEERWGRAVDDRSFSSILNFALEKIHEIMTCLPQIFEFRASDMPELFAREAFAEVFSMSRDALKKIDKPTYESLAMDIVEARSFLFGARACKFVLDLLSVPGVERHIDSAGGWGTVEAFCSTFYNLNLYEGSENEHFVQLREVRDLIFMLEDADSRFQETVEKCEYNVRRLRRTFNFKTQSAFVNNLKLHLAAEKKEYFPLVVDKEEG